MTKARAAAIYARISRDTTGEGLGIERQLEDCRRLAADRGWIVAEEYVDNDFSAYRGKRRPAYERMLADLERGQRDAVIAYHTDRLTRRPIELEQFTGLCERAGVRLFATVTADIDLGNDDGMFMARVLAAVAAKESGRKSERQRRKARQLAEEGKPNGGNYRPFGYQSDRVTVVESEAEVIQQLATRYLAGESLKSLTEWMQAEGILSVAQKPWRTSTLRTTLMNPRIAGLRAHLGEVVGPAQWPAIITPSQHEQLVAKFTSRAASDRRAPRRYLLSGMLRCGKCGGKLFSSVRRDRQVTTRRYVCSSSPDHGGCGKLTAVAAPIEEWITEAVLMRLDNPAVTDAIEGRASADDRHAILSAELDADRSQMRELAELWADKVISSAEWKAAREPIEARIHATERQLSSISGTHTLDGWVGNSAGLRQAWATLNLTRQAAIIAAVLDYATIAPGQSGARALDPSRIIPTWSL
jgi:DNA invertase Pin-like site-specific DNA recombinase